MGFILPMMNIPIVTKSICFVVASPSLSSTASSEPIVNVDHSFNQRCVPGREANSCNNGDILTAMNAFDEYRWT